MELISLGFANYRSIGAEPVFIDMTKKVNIFIGANNSGKSNIIRALEWFGNGPGKLLAADSNNTLSQTDSHQTNNENIFSVSVKLHMTEEERSPSPEKGPVELVFTMRDKRFECISNSFSNIAYPRLVQYFTRTFQARHTGSGTRDDQRKLALEISMRLAREALKTEIPYVHIIPQFRQIKDGDKYCLDGQGIVATLASWQHPQIGKDRLMARFQKIRELLRKLLHMPTVNIEVQHDNSQIIVERDGLRLPLESYGTGVHELIILAIAVYSQDNVLFCIEEPEIHLHPRLQKEFLSFLIESTSNKYVLTTHSNAFLIPSKEVQVSHLWLQDEATRSRTIETPEHALSVLSDLGIKASDILQANSVIWVEGPSDRIYINHWLGLLEPDLREGIDYSIMFYGGSLLSHLSMGRTAAETADELIELLRINQNSMVVIDSDNKNEKSNINTTKQRVRRECRQNGLAYWITWGREIENYISAKCIATAYGEITGTTPDGLSFGKFDKLEKCLTAAYGKKWKPSWSYNDAKPARARELVKCITKEDLDKPLLKNIKPLIDAIILATRDPESSG